MNVRFLINTMTAWDEPPRARHQVTSALAKKFKVVFVASNKIGYPRIEYTQIENITLVQPYFPINLKIRYRLPLLNESYQIWLFRKLREKYGNTEVINFDFTAYLIHSFFQKVYFYCNDNFTEISRKINNYFIYKYHVYCERKLASSAQLCIATSSVILDHIKQINPNSHLLLLGGPNIDEYQTKPVLPGYSEGTINVGLIGFIRNYNISVSLLNDIIEKLDCIITLIGPVESDFIKNIRKKDKVLLKGVLTGHELIKEVNKFDVAIAPYVDKKINEGAFPNKLLIYLALGKPVVVTELLSLKQISLPEKLVYFAKSNHEFPKVIQDAHKENKAEYAERRIQYSKENTWDIRINKFLELVRTNS